MVERLGEGKVYHPVVKDSLGHELAQELELVLELGLEAGLEVPG